MRRFRFSKALSITLLPAFVISLSAAAGCSGKKTEGTEDFVTHFVNLVLEDEAWTVSELRILR